MAPACHATTATIRGLVMYVINEKYRNSRKIDFNRWSDAPEVHKLADDLVEGMKADCGIKKLTPYRYNMITLLMELYHSHLTDQEQYLAYYRKSSMYHFKITLTGKGAEGRYNKNPHITFVCFKGCVDYLASKDYIENVDGGSYRDDEGEVTHSYTARMRAAKGIVALWEQYGFSPDMIKRFQPEETIILKGKMYVEHYVYKGKKRKRKVKPLIPDYKDTLAVQAMRRRVEAYNLLLDRAHIDIDVDCITQADREDLLDRLLHAKDKFRYTINLGAKQVYRVFNNGKWNEGGRFYGAWWIGCPGILRKYITIDGEPTVELDYGGIHINLLYAFKGINFADLNTDAYELVENDPERKLNKLILLTAYNAESPEETAKAVFDSARRDGVIHKLKLRKHSQVYEKLELLKQKHPEIKGYIAEGYGRKLQYHDATVLEGIINLFTKMKIPIITVHDSIICQARYKEFVREKMLQYYVSHVNKAFNCNIEYVPEYKYGTAVVAPEYNMALPVGYALKKPVIPANIKAVTADLRTKIKPYQGRIPTIQNNVIEVDEESMNVRCSKRCHHHQRDVAIRTGRRIFLGKIRIQTRTIEKRNTLRDCTIELREPNPSP